MKSINERSPLFHQANPAAAAYPDWIHARSTVAAAQYGTSPYNPLAGLNMLPGMVPFPGSHNLPWANNISGATNLTNQEAVKSMQENGKISQGGAQIRDLPQALAGYNFNHLGNKMDLFTANNTNSEAMKAYEKTHNMMQSILYSKGPALGSPNNRSPDSKLVDHDRISIP